MSSSTVDHSFHLASCDLGFHVALLDRRDHAHLCTIATCSSCGTPDGPLSDFTMDFQ